MHEIAAVNERSRSHPHEHTAKILLTVLLLARAAMPARAADDKAADVKSHEHVARTGFFEIRPLHAWPFMPPRYRVHRAGIGHDTDVSQLANVVSCNRFNLPLSWFCFDNPLAGAYEVIGDRPPEIMTTTGMRKAARSPGEK